MKMHDNRIGAGIAGALLLGIAAVELFAASGLAGANVLTALIGIAMLIASAAGLRPE